MSRLLRNLWDDEDGGVISIELVLIIGILIFGLIPGLVALRNSGISLLATLGNLANALIPSFTYSGFSIVSGGQTILQVSGASFSPDYVNLSASQIPPIAIDPNTVVVPPAP